VKKFTFRFTVTYTYDITLTEEQIYPDFAWTLYPEHHMPKKRSVNGRKPARAKRPKLTAAKVMKTVHANGGPREILRKWNLGPDFIEGAYPTGDLDPEPGTEVISRKVKLSVRKASRSKAACPERPEHAPENPP
jgi:hypothetical protein